MQHSKQLKINAHGLNLNFIQVFLKDIYLPINLLPVLSREMEIFKTIYLYRVV